MPSDTYSTFIGRVRELNSARSIEALLDWDQETQMPPKGAEDRANQSAFIAGVVHERLTSDELGGLLAKVESEGDSDPVVATNVREMRREFDRARKLPKQLVEDLARTSALAKDAWAGARKASNFAAFAPHLQKLIDIKREIADRVGWKTEPYDALMDEYEPGAKASDVQAVFDRLKADLVPLVDAIAKSRKQPDLKVLERPAPREQQQAFNRKLVAAMGFDLEAGRIDTTTHPFCSGFTARDVRLTNRYNESFLQTSLFGILHEAGHGLYEQGFDHAHIGTPMARATSLGIHESQSRMWENLVGRSLEFWKHFYPLLQAEFSSYSDVTLEQWHFAINAVRPSFIRVEADEVTYALHIILRFGLERRLIRGELAVKDVAAAWNDGMKELLGVTPPDDARGCLQDIHWSLGTFGYFPTYSLGNLYASQFWEQANKEMPDLNARIARGDLLPLRDWLRAKIHSHGMRYRAGELLKVVTGQELSHAPFVRYLNGKFRAMYAL